MGDGKRRRALYSELKMIPSAEVAAMPMACAWDGCNAHTAYPGDDGRLADGWRILYMLRRYVTGQLPNGEPVLRVMSPEAGVERDAVLCPRHARELEQALKPLGNEVLAEPQGTA